MNSFPDFDVRWILVCDYMSQMADGKFTFAGVYTETMLFENENVGTASPFNIAICLQPKQQKFDISLKLTDPAGATVADLSVGIQGETPPAAYDRLVVPISVPPLPFRGFGDYSVVVVEEERETTIHTLTMWCREMVTPN